MAKPSREELAYQKNDDKLRIKMAARLKLTSIPDALWEKFAGGIAEVIEASDRQEGEYYEDKLYEGLKKGRTLAAQILDQALPPGRTPGHIPQYQPTEAEWDREAAIMAFYARQWSQLPEIQQFREQLGSLMPPEQVWLFLTSPLTQLFTFAELKASNVDPFRTKGEVVEENVVSGGGAEWLRQITVAIQPGGILQTVTHDPHMLLAMASNKLTGDAQFLIDTYINRPEQRVQFPASYFTQSSISSGQYGEISGYAGTVVGEALRLSDDIAVRHHLEAMSILLFLLTGRIPRTNPIQTVLVPRPCYGLDGEDTELIFGPVVLVVQPWVSALSLQHHYRVLQHEMFGKDNSSVQERNLVLFNFVNNHWGKVPGRNKTEKWANLLDLWREMTKGAPPEDAFSDTFDWRNLRATYSRIKKVLLPPLA